MLWNRFAQALEDAQEHEEDKCRYERGDQQDSELDEQEIYKEWSLPDALETALVAGVFLAEVLYGPGPVAPQAGQYAVIRCLPLYEDAVLQNLVALLGVVVRLFEAKESMLVMSAVPDYLLLACGAHLEHFRSVEDAGIAVGAFLLVQEERPLGTERIGYAGDAESLHGGVRRPAESIAVEAVVVICKAVGNAIDMGDFRREAAQRLDESGVAVYVPVQAGDNLVVGEALGCEFIVLVRHGAQGVSKVESEILLLGVQYERQLIALLHSGDHLAPLAAILLREPFFGCDAFLIITVEFRAQGVYGLAQVPFVEHSECGTGYKQCRREDN